MSVAELKYFRDELERIGNKLKEENIRIQDSFDDIGPEGFSNILNLFLELSELAGDLGAKEYKRYFDGFAEVTSYCLKVNNVRAHKKVAMMSLDYQALLQGLIDGFQQEDKIKAIVKAFEVQIFKQERLKRGEFFSLVNEKSLRA